MYIAGEDELYLGYPLFNGLRFWLRPLVVLLEVIREVSVQVESSGVVSVTFSIVISQLPLLGQAIVGNTATDKL